MSDKNFMKSFSEKVLMIVRKIPKGKTMTYKQVAEKDGSPRAFRAVGSIIKKNYDNKIPCHRVVLSDGSLGEYNRGVSLKKRMLEEEKEFIPRCVGLV